MNKTITKWNPFCIGDYQYVESWLNDMAARGYLYKESGFFRISFEESDNKARRYRLIPSVRFFGGINEHEKEIYEASGWTYCEKPIVGCNAFYADDPFAPEIFSDKVSRKRYFRPLIGQLIPLIICVLIWIYIYARDMKNLFDFSSIYHDISGGFFFPEIACHACMIIVFLLLFLYYVSLSLGLLKTAAYDDAKPHDIPYEKRMKRGKRLQVIFIAAFAGMLISHFILNSGGPEEILGGNNYSLEDFTAENSFHLEEFDRELADEIRTVDALMKSDEYEFSEETPYTEYTVYNDGHFLFPIVRSVDVRVRTDGNSENAVSAYADGTYGEKYLEATDDKIADRWIREEVALNSYSTDWIFDDQGRVVDVDEEPMDYEEIRIELPGTDYAGFATDDDGWQYLFLRKGNKVKCVSYEGEKDLFAAVDLYIGDIS